MKDTFNDFITKKEAIQFIQSAYEDIHEAYDYPFSKENRIELSDILDKLQSFLAKNK